jgi:hypothetical protein
MSTQQRVQLVTVLAALVVAIPTQLPELAKVLSPGTIILILVITNLLSAVLPALKVASTPQSPVPSQTPDSATTSNPVTGTKREGE